MSYQKSRLKSDPQNEADSQWKSLYKIGGTAALIAAALALIEIAIEGSGGSGLASTPSSAQDWFTLLQTNRLLGLAVLGTFETAFFPLTVIMFLGLFVILRRVNKSWMTIAVVFYLIGTTVYFASNNALAMLGLANQYAATTTEAQKSVLLAAGQAVMATEQGTGMAMTFFLSSLAGLIVSIVMLRSRTFGKTIGVIGIVANVFGLPGSGLGLIFWTVNGLFMLVWIVMVGVRLLQLSRKEKVMEVPQ